MVDDTMLAPLIVVSPKPMTSLAGWPMDAVYADTPTAETATAVTAAATTGLMRMSVTPLDGGPSLAAIADGEPEFPSATFLGIRRGNLQRLKAGTARITRSESDRRVDGSARRPESGRDHVELVPHARPARLRDRPV